MPRKFKIFDEESVLKFECNLKHMCAEHALGKEEVTSIASSQLFEEDGDVQDILRKVMHVASTTNDLEDLIMAYMEEFLLKDADRSGQMRVDEEDLKQFIWQYGHFVLTEEHFELYIGREVRNLQKVKSEEEKKTIKERIQKLCNFLYVARTHRKKFLSGFLEKVSVGTPEVANF